MTNKRIMMKKLGDFLNLIQPFINENYMQRLQLL